MKDLVVSVAAQRYVYSKKQATTDSLGYAEAFAEGAKWRDAKMLEVINKWANDNWIGSPTHEDSFWQNRLIESLRKIVRSI